MLFLDRVPLFSVLFLDWTPLSVLFFDWTPPPLYAIQRPDPVLSLLFLDWIPHFSLPLVPATSSPTPFPLPLFSRRTDRTLPMPSTEASAPSLLRPAAPPFGISLSSAPFIDALESAGEDSEVPGAAGVWETLYACPQASAACYQVGGTCARRPPPFAAAALPQPRAWLSGLRTMPPPPPVLEDGTCVCPAAAPQWRRPVLPGDPHGGGGFACDCACVPEPPPSFLSTGTGVLLVLALSLILSLLFLCAWAGVRAARGLGRALRANREQLTAAKERVREAIFSVFNCRRATPSGPELPAVFCLSLFV